MAAARELTCCCVVTKAREKSIASRGSRVRRMVTAWSAASSGSKLAGGLRTRMVGWFLRLSFSKVEGIYYRALTLNSSFQRRESRDTHQSCRTPVSVTMLSKETGVTSEAFSAAGKLTSIGGGSGRG